MVKALGQRAVMFAPLLHNTVSPTMLHASEKVNVIPSEVELGLDGRLLPGFKPEDMTRELRALLGDDFDLEIVMFDPGPAAPNLGLFEALGAVLPKAYSARTRPRGRGRAAGTQRRDRRALLLPPGHPDLRLHPAQAAGGFQLHPHRPRRG